MSGVFVNLINESSDVGDNSVHIKQQLESYLYEIRIEAEVFVEEMVRLQYLLNIVC